MEKFLTLFKEALEIEDREIGLNDNFREFAEWNSLANLSLIAMVDEEFGVVIENAKFREVSTVGALWEMIEKRINN